MTVTFCIKGIGKAKLRKPSADLLHLFHLWSFHSFRHAYNTLSLVFTLWLFPIPLFLLLTPFFPAHLSSTSSLLSVWGPEFNRIACRSVEELRKGYLVPQVISNAFSPLGRECLPEELDPYSLYVDGGGGHNFCRDFRRTVALCLDVCFVHPLTLTLALIIRSTSISSEFPDAWRGLIRMSHLGWALCHHLVILSFWAQSLISTLFEKQIEKLPNILGAMEKTCSLAICIVHSI